MLSSPPKNTVRSLLGVWGLQIVLPVSVHWKRVCTFSLLTTSFFRQFTLRRNSICLNLKYILSPILQILLGCAQLLRLRAGTSATNS
jgi:hypothetical protein